MNDYATDLIEEIGREHREQRENPEILFKRIQEKLDLEIVEKEGE